MKIMTASFTNCKNRAERGYGHSVMCCLILEITKVCPTQLSQSLATGQRDPDRDSLAFLLSHMRFPVESSGLLLFPQSPRQLTEAQMSIPVHRVLSTKRECLGNRTLHLGNLCATTHTDHELVMANTHNYSAGIYN